MKTLRVSLYVLVVIVFLLLFDVAMGWLIAELVRFQETTAVDTNFWFILKMAIGIPVFILIFYFFTRGVRQMSGLIAKLSPLKIFNFYFILTLLIINGLYGILNTWFNLDRQYNGIIIIANLVATGIIIDFSYVLFKGHTTETKAIKWIKY